MKRWTGVIAGCLAGLKRLRHWRGHGIHSPFVYSLKREVLMRRTLCGADRDVFGRLRNAGIRQNKAVIISNLFFKQNYTDMVICGTDEMTPSGDTLIVVPAGVCPEQIRRAASLAARSRCALVVFCERRSPWMKKTCTEFVKKNDCLSVDRGDFFIYFYNHRLPVLHFKI